MIFSIVLIAYRAPEWEQPSSRAIRLCPHPSATSSPTLARLTCAVPGRMSLSGSDRRSSGDMAPTFTAHDSRDLALDDAELGGELCLRDATTRVAVVDLAHPFVRQSRRVAIFPFYPGADIAPQLYGVARVSETSDPLEVGHRVVRAIGVDVVHLGQVLFIRDEGFGHKAVHVAWIPGTQEDLPVSVTGVDSERDFPVGQPDPALVAHLVARVAVDLGPAFGGHGRTRHTFRSLPCEPFRLDFVVFCTSGVNITASARSQ